MLKFFFWCLLAVNAVLFVLGRGYLGDFSAAEREPGRMQNQLNADSLTLLPAGDGKQAAAPAVAAAPAPAPVAAAPAPAPEKAPPAPAPAPKAAAPAPVLACVEVGNFSTAQARRFDAAIAPLGLGQRLSQHSVQSQEITSYIVYIPPQPSKEIADKKAAELKELGVTNFFIMSESTAMRFAISLGVFKTEAAAQTMLATLIKQGVHSARVGPRYAAGKLTAYQLRNLDGADKSGVDKALAGFSDITSHSCK